LQINTSGEFGGLGIEVGIEDGFIKVIAPIDDTPAQRAGIQTGDLIIKLDDEGTKGLSLPKAVELMRGKPGSTLTLTVIREGEPKPLEIELTRAVIQVASVKSRLLEPGYGYLRVTQFQVHTGENLKKAILDMHENTVSSDNTSPNEHVPLKGMVLDLRNNPGGVLQAAVEVSDLFLDEGVVVYTKGRIANSEMRFNASAGDIINGAPLIVLVNGGSASASEIVAGALQDHKRAVIMGTATFGKGSVQTILPLHDDRAIKLTTARYFTPNDRSIQAQGIVPDIHVKPAKITQISTQIDDFKEANLHGHLKNREDDERKKKNRILQSNTFSYMKR